ncbi:hypothetical protein HZH68_005745 [Vespula germanica]|uniref:Uncharacterized protein n=1 Tax=Vespula germanica TaxID=30212 RepID=A0A834KIA2_VESGE|nr:hypothetical protein HZH68_005745 [Vespula germanica]
MVHEVAARRAAKGYGFDGYRVGELVREIIRRARACRWKPHAALFKLNPRGGNGGVEGGGGGGGGGGTGTGGSDCGGGGGGAAAAARGGGNDLSIATSPYDPLRLPRRHSSERCSDRRPHRTTYGNNPPHEGEYGYLRSRRKGGGGSGDGGGGDGAGSGGGSDGVESVKGVWVARW